MNNSGPRSRQHLARPFFPPHVRCKVQLFWAAAVSPRFTPLSSNIVRETCGYLGLPPIIVSLRGATMQLANVTDRTWREQLLPASFTSQQTTDVACVCIGETDVLLCGGRTPQSTSLKHACLWTAGSLVSVADMTTRRSGHSLLFAEDYLSVYAFGGSRLPSCERFDLIAQKWTWIGDLNSARNPLAISRRGDSVFLLPLACTHIDQFSLRSNQFFTVALGVLSPVRPLAVVQYDLLCVNRLVLTKVSLQSQPPSLVRPLRPDEGLFLQLDLTILNGFAYTWNGTQHSSVSWELSTGKLVSREFRQV